jgi:hypothetical protein
MAGSSIALLHEWTFGPSFDEISEMAVRFVSV